MDIKIIFGIYKKLSGNTAEKRTERLLKKKKTEYQEVWDNIVSPRNGCLNKDKTLAVSVDMLT